MPKRLSSERSLERNCLNRKSRTDGSQSSPLFVYRLCRRLLVLSSRVLNLTPALKQQAVHLLPILGKQRRLMISDRCKFPLRSTSKRTLSRSISHIFSLTFGDWVSAFDHDSAGLSMSLRLRPCGPRGAKRVRNLIIPNDPVPFVASAARGNSPHSMHYSIH
jgi:hypothetical protein